MQTGDDLPKREQHCLQLLEIREHADLGWNPAFELVLTEVTAQEPVNKFVNLKGLLAIGGLEEQSMHKAHDCDLVLAVQIPYGGNRPIQFNVFLFVDPQEHGARGLTAVLVA